MTGAQHAQRIRGQQPVDVSGELHTAPASQFWIGRYIGPRFTSVHVTPVAIRFDATPEPDLPQGYAMTIVIGQLLIQGVRFTTPTLAVPVDNELGLPQIWPPAGPVGWQDGTAVYDTAFLDVASAKTLRSAEPPMQVRPWTPATELPASQAVRHMVELPTICGQSEISEILAGRQVVSYDLLERISEGLGIARLDGTGLRRARRR